MTKASPAIKSTSNTTPSISGSHSPPLLNAAQNVSNDTVTNNDDDDDDDFFILNKYIPDKEVKEFEFDPSFNTQKDSSVSVGQEGSIPGDSTKSSLNADETPVEFKELSGSNTPDSVQVLTFETSESDREEDFDSSEYKPKRRKRSSPSSNRNLRSSTKIGSVDPIEYSAPVPAAFDDSLDLSSASPNASSATSEPVISSLELLRKRREERRLQELRENPGDNGQAPFEVGLFIRTGIRDLESVPTVSLVIKSNEKIGPAFKQYFETALEHTKSFPVDTTIFVWNSQRIFELSTPSLLGVSQTAPTMLVTAYIKEVFEETSQREFDEKLKGLEELDYDKLSEAKLEEGKLALAAQEAEKSKSESPSNEVAHFPIVLKGKDNKPIIVKVSATTPIEKIAKYYLTQKGIDMSKLSDMRLVFDDEDIDIGGVVGDTELEADFSVDVYVD